MFELYGHNPESFKLDVFFIFIVKTFKY